MPFNPTVPHEIARVAISMSLHVDIAVSLQARQTVFSWFLYERPEMSLRALVVDDEALARQQVLDLLAGDDFVTCIGECADSRSAIEMIRRERPDVVFLDIQMPDLDGFDILEAVQPEHQPKVVFTNK